jgi:hypothetical protein
MRFGRNAFRRFNDLLRGDAETQMFGHAMTQGGRIALADLERPRSCGG